VSHITTGKLRMDLGLVDLRGVVDAALETVRPLAEAKGIALELAGAREELWVAGDGQRLQQVVWNLASNAIKFTPSGGRVDLTLGREGGAACLRVCDNGVGISPEFLPHVFERFRQAEMGTARSHGGLGLGLTIAHYIVEAHRGRIAAESGGVGTGACFTVELPLATGEKAEATPLAGQDSVPEKPRLADAKVLVVDDEPDTRELLRTVLALEGAQVRVAGSVREALAAVSEGRPDLIISDIGMPAEDGFGLLAKLRALPPEVGGDVPAVALTAHATAEDVERSRAAGYELHLTKPIERGSVVAALASLLASRGRTNGTPEVPLS
jgi:CheY-like chemotaxis protein